MGSTYERYVHSVLRAMLAKSDDELFVALRDMQQHLVQNGIEKKAVAASSLNDKFFDVNDFKKAVKTSQVERLDNFVIALRVRGLLNNESFWLTDQVFSWFLDRPDLQRRFVSAALLRKSELFAKAIKQGSTVDANLLSRPSEVLTRNAPKPPATFTFEDAQKPIVLDGAGGKSTGAPNSGSPGVMASNASPEIVKDREQQDKTGYLKGQPKSATGGMSSFKVDNQQGSSDAVARIYLDGIKPAVRSMYVRKGEVFSAQSLVPGTYVFRYRFIGSDDTFESDKTFVLTETKTETGTRYSTVMVTLFKVQGGNMSSRKVDSASF